MYPNIGSGIADHNRDREKIGSGPTILAGEKHRGGEVVGGMRGGKGKRIATADQQSEFLYHVTGSDAVEDRL